MEQQDRREPIAIGAEGSPAARHALILNASPAYCAVNCCGSLGNSLRDEFAFGHIHESSVKFLPENFPFIPDVLFVRLPRGLAAQELITSCKKAWRDASIVALICPALERLTQEFSTLLRFVDDFLLCPFSDSELLLRIRRILRPGPPASRSSPRHISDATQQAIPIVGESAGFKLVLEKISRLAQCRDTVLISGETGSGKEVFSRAIHYQSARRGKPFVPVNCGALPDHLFENELFGHMKGAFTDASSTEKGLIAEAEGGTLFLDEIDTLSYAGQVKLLRFLQDGEYRPVGSARAVHADVRVIAATNTDLLKRVEAKLFREDLYYRLHSLSISIPSLRERIEDVVPLTMHFLEQHARGHGNQVHGITPEAMEKLMAYAWPGNIRELESVITRALTFTRAAELQSEDIEVPAAPAGEPAAAKSLREAKSKTVALFERRYLSGLLAQHRGNVTHAARAAGKERRSFQRLLRKHNLDRHSFQQ